MTYHPQHLIEQWLPKRDSQQWVLGAVFRTQGSAYRKAGALMLFGDNGEQLGLLSGGCLESDLQRKAMQVMQTREALQVRYDSDDEEDVSYQLGIGCGGVVEVMLHPVEHSNDYLGLVALYKQLSQHQSAVWALALPERGLPSQGLHLDGTTPTALELPKFGDHTLTLQLGKEWLVNRYQPVPHLAIFGGGADARPLAGLATQLGWQVTLIDPRPSHARREQFPTVHRVVRAAPSSVLDSQWGQTVDAAVVMNHQLELDAEALHAIANLPLRYCALLGPSHRKQQVLSKAKIEHWHCHCPLAGPAGLAIGAQLPEGIALAILSECHAALFGGKGGSLSQVLCRQ
ncbi:XdhC family protein [Ferrimonas marina]|uniref:Xanthine dehydrogenase accessory factor n=1 Tax=Ferrimonas marina TaxID=299255 RepID=A0A1M5XXY6_9GAMM|nr:XdhC/CoxI family protein [Ferrimonas marina]SHI04685.1 xanthine dehydrogenase accessory factor [Ferrimonas marina]